MELFIYLFKVNIAIILMHGFYGLLVREDTFFQWKRFFLLSIPVIALLFPLVNISWFPNQGTLPVSGNVIFPSYYLNEVTITADAKQSTGNFSFTDYLPALLKGIYWIGATIILIRILAQIISVLFLLIKTKKTKINGQTIYQKDGLQDPFSFFRYIVLDLQKYPAYELQEIIRHEGTHVRQWHSLDVMMAEIMIAFFWFNPFVWLMKREIRMNLEYLADRSVIDSGLSKEHYQFHLMRLTYHKAAAKITNNFNVSPLKKRIFMMNKKETSRLGLAKYLFVLPVIAALFIFNKYDIYAKNMVVTQMQTDPVKNAPPIYVVDGVLVDNINNLSPDRIASISILKDASTVAKYGSQAVNGVIAITTKDSSSVSIKDLKGRVVSMATKDKSGDKNKEVFMHVEAMPRFPDGDAAMLKWLHDNTIYPTSAAEKGIQGRVVLKYIVRSDGSIDDVQVVRSLDPDCDAEAVRVLQAMPKWIPGTQNGKPVDVYYNLPIQFKLQAGKEAFESPALTSTQTVSTVVEIDGKVVTEEEWKNADPAKLELQIFGAQKNSTRKILIFKTKQ
ncbi:MAG: TonB family protein [Candidatus Azobacteroides sp.]|nr:TonB family protein [Candidatus Azobacteroides sp.]